MAQEPNLFLNGPMIDIDHQLSPQDLRTSLAQMWEASAACIHSIDNRWRARDGAPVFTVEGRYTARGWTEWTQGFQWGASLLQFDATGESAFLELGRERTREAMAPHVTHHGVHDHGFNNLSTYGNLWRLMGEGKVPENAWERAFYELALKCSGAVQAARWAVTEDGTGYIYSFNGPQSLFVDTLRSLRIVVVAHQLGHALHGEQDSRICLLRRAVEHARNTARFNVWYGDGRDRYDVAGRTAHESIFNTQNGSYRCPSTQQGYSAFSTWTRGLAWAMLGFAEQLEWLTTRPDEELESLGGRGEIEAAYLRAATATCDFYIDETPTCGVPYWDTGAPQLHRLGDYRHRPAEPFNDVEPVDASAAAIASQGLLRFGHWLEQRETNLGRRYLQAGLTVLRTLLSDLYLSTDPRHEGLLLHAVYHHPNAWDYAAPNSSVPSGESCMWGDYHLREVAVLVGRWAEGQTLPYFFGAECG